MRPRSSPGDAAPARTASAGTPARQLEALHQGFRARLLPLLAEAREATEAELRRLAGEAPDDELAEALANAVVLQHDASRHRRSWEGHLAQGFAGWPTPPDAAKLARGFALVSDGELHAQLIGQPAVEALERRFADVLGIIDGRLWSMAASLGGHARPLNPFAPRAVIDAFLETFSATECDPILRSALLRQYERLCGPCLLEAYAWLNTALAEGGHALDGASGGATLLSQPVAGRGGQPAWAGHDALEPQASSWRESAAGRVEHGTGRRRILCDRLRAAQGPESRTRAPSVRDFSEQEFSSVLSLLQGNETPRQPVPVPGSIGAHLRESIRTGAAGLGLPEGLAAPSPAQDDAIDAVGALFDGLRAEAALSPDVRGRLARLAWPWLRLALADPALFEDPAHPAMRLLSGLVACWDANPARSDDEAALHALADGLADRVANDYHDEAGVFTAALDELEATRAPLERRAAIGERRAWQSVLGGERLQEARRDADAHLAARLGRAPLLAEVAGFLSGAWRQSLAMAWLRDGPGSARHREALAIGDELLEVDAAAAAAQGRDVADRLIALGPQLRTCLLAGGIADAGADEQLAGLVAALARPDAPRMPATFVPLAEPDARETPTGSGDEAVAAVGQVLVGHASGGEPPTWLRLAWTSPVSGRLLLVNRQGARTVLLAPGDLAAALAAGQLVARPPGGAVEAVLQRLAGRPAG